MRKICKGWRTFMKNYEQHLTNEIEKLKEEIKKLKNKDNDVIKNTLWCNCNHNNKTYDLNYCTWCGGKHQFDYEYKHR